MPRRMRCAVYTRKSSEEGLDMEFNLLRGVENCPPLGVIGVEN
jgi:hypothetical protein